LGKFSFPSLSSLLPPSQTLELRQLPPLLTNSRSATINFLPTSPRHKCKPFPPQEQHSYGLEEKDEKGEREGDGLVDFEAGFDEWEPGRRVPVEDGDGE